MSLHTIVQIGGLVAGVILRWWGKAKPVPVAQPPILRLVAPVPPPEAVAPSPEVVPAPAPAAAPVPEHQPAFRFKAQLLDRLPLFETYLRRARKQLKDEDFDALARQGIAICPNDAMVERQPQLHPYFVQQLPTFGAYAFLDQPTHDPEWVAAQLCWFRRMKRAPFNVQPESPEAVAVYVMLVYWDDNESDRLRRLGRGFYDELVVEVRRDGSLRPLRKRQPYPQTIRHRNGTTSTLYRSEFGFGSFSNGGTSDPVERIIGMFCHVTNFWTQSTAAQVRVKVTRGKQSLAFAIDVNSVPKFFDDRVPVHDARGRKMSIFRIVRPHVRVRNGKRIPIKMHAAGLRDFDWNGWRIHISVPGLDHVSIEQVNLALLDEEQERRDGNLPKDTQSLRSMIDETTQHMDGVQFAKPLFGYAKPKPDAVRRRA